jgi:hypothetical protein
VRLGQIVLYTYPKAEQAPGHVNQAPAIVVRLLDNDRVNLRLFSDSVPHGAEYRVEVSHVQSDAGYYEPRTIPVPGNRNFLQEVP